MNREIDANILSLKKVLCDEDKFFSVPEYQRPYSWDNEHLSALIDDLVESYKDKSCDYFCGSLVLVKNAQSSRFDIIDGQQRITTFIIMACVFRDHYSESLEDREKEHIDNSIKDKHKENGNKIKFLAAAEVQNTFEQTVLNGITEKKDFKNNRYLENAHHLIDFIKEKIENKEIENINDFVQWLFESIKLTEIICDKEDRAIQIFNILNARGLPLSAVDIFKSSLMGKILKEEDRKKLNEDWKGIKTSLEDRDLSIEDMLITYQHYKNPIVQQERLDKILIKKLQEEEQTPLEMIHEIKKFNNSYIEVHEEKNKYIQCLKNLAHKSWKSILVTAYFNDYKYKESLSHLLVAYYYQSWIAGGTGARVKAISFEVLRKIKKNEGNEEIKKALTANLKKYPSYRETISNQDIIGYNWVKPLLLLIEYFLVDESSNSIIPNNKNLTIEHILPQEPNTEWELDQEIQDKWRNSLANLTLLSRRKNSQAKNYSFAEKKKVYQDRDNVTSAFIMIREICKEDKWNIESLERRKEYLFKKVAEKLELF